MAKAVFMRRFIASGAASVKWQKAAVGVAERSHRPDNAHRSAEINGIAQKRKKSRQDSDQNGSECVGFQRLKKTRKER